MAATGKTPILLYGSTTPTNAPSAGNLTNSSDGCEIAINVADKNLFFKDLTNAVNTVPLRQSSVSSNGWLSSTDWNTFNNKASTSSPTFSGDVTLSTGNLVIGTSGKGIDFSATAGTGTSELLADYEEGTWTPVVVPGAGAITTQTCSGRYTKFGRTVYIEFSIVINNAGTASSISNITGIPFASANVASVGSGGVREYNTTGFAWVFTVDPNSTVLTANRYDNSTFFITGYAWRGSLTYST